MMKNHNDLALNDKSTAVQFIVDDKIDLGEENDNSTITRNDFPYDFIFGTGTAAYQHEGSAAKGGRGPSIWDDFALRTPNRINGGSNGNVAIDMYTRYKEDIQLMKKMGFDAYRFSISWSRILPGGKPCRGINREGIDYYNDVINTVLANGLQPYVTLFHFDLPYSLQEEYGGFLSKKVVNDFRAYVDLCFWEFGDRVKHWITMNEPWSYSVHGYVDNHFPPSKPSPHVVYGVNRDTNKFGGSKYTNAVTYRNNINNDNHDPNSTIDDDDDDSDVGDDDNNYSPKNTYTVTRHLLLAHAAAVHLYRTKFQEHQQGKIGITLVCHWFEPYMYNVSDTNAAKRALDFMLGWFLEPIMSGQYPKSMVEYVPKERLKPFSPKESQMLKGSIDFLGLNYYTANYAADDPHPLAPQGYYMDQKVAFITERDGKPIGKQGGSSWLYIVPWGIRKLLKHVKYTYKGVPAIYITENGVDEKNNCNHTATKACADPVRVKYHQDHLANILSAMKDYNINVKGYFLWAYADNYEWSEGYSVRFGIIYIDFMNSLTRCAKESAMWFSKFLVRIKLLQQPKKRQLPKDNITAGNYVIEDIHDQPDKRIRATTTMEEY